MPAFPRRLGNLLDKPADHDHQFRELLREARKLAKLSLDPKTRTLKGRVGLMSASYTREEFDKATSGMAKLFTNTDPGMRLTWRTKLLTMSTEAELKDIWEKIMALRRQTWSGAPASAFGLDGSSKVVDENAQGEGEGEPVMVEVTEEFIGGLVERMFEAMGCVFAGTETKNERYIRTCDTIAKLLQGEEVEDSDDYGKYMLERDDIDAATMSELRMVAHQIAGHYGRKSNGDQTQPSTARAGSSFTAPPPSMPTTARGSNPTPYPTIAKIVATPRGAPTAVPPPVPPASSMPVVMSGVEVSEASSSTTPTSSVEVSATKTKKMNPLSRMIPMSTKPALPPREGPARPPIPGMGGSGSGEKYEMQESEYCRQAETMPPTSLSARIAIDAPNPNPFDVPTWTK